jgi:hypothetical protein
MAAEEGQGTEMKRGCWMAAFFWVSELRIRLDISTFRTASIFIVSELVHMYTAVVWKKTCDGCTEWYEGEWQIAATKMGGRDRTFPSQ